MKKMVLIGLLGSFANIVNANPSVQINQESFDLIKSALIRVLKENKDLKERIKDLEDRTQRNTDNLLMVAKNLGPKIEKIMLAQDKTLEYRASVVNINPQKKAKESTEILNILNNREIVKVTFTRGSNIREKAGLDYAIVNRFNAGDTVNIVNYERIGNNIWYELEQGGWTHFHNVNLTQEITQDLSQESSKESKSNNIYKETNEEAVQNIKETLSEESKDNEKTKE
ncbi:SH3 domain-containing protein [Helicobacter apodemus]|uniref:SH3 domain-containing protein n=1 Tax=Helicobacter apodemus TaxID=135569 RepID=A0A4U8UBX5_9HELI|nr:SH3 domain-containing protein [Helicobacter apodemus]TLE13549.1 SH3 domain-containing protein [Helicobacter apodemus]